MFKAAYTEGCDAIITNVFTDDISSMIDAHVVSRKSPIATVTAGQTLTTTLSERVNFTTNFVVRTFTGPQTVYTTTSNSLVGQWFTDGHMGPAAPGYRCSGKCFECQLFFFTVSVFYWPTGPVNTDCLDAISSTTMAGTLLSRGVKVEARSLTGMAPDATTFITNGFTL